MNARTKAAGRTISSLHISKHTIVRILVSVRLFATGKSAIGGFQDLMNFRGINERILGKRSSNAQFAREGL